MQIPSVSLYFYRPVSLSPCRPLSSLSWQRESHHVIARLRARLAVSSGANYDELFAIHRVGHWSGLSACRELAFPERFSGFDVERAQLVIHRGGDEGETARGDHRAAKID